MKIVKVLLPMAFLFCLASCVEINEDIAGMGVDGLEMGGEAFTGAFDDESIIGTEGCCGCCCMTTC